MSISESIFDAHDHLIKEWLPTLNREKKPLEFLPQSEYEAYWLCENGHTYKRWIGVRTRKPSIQCPSCKRENKK